MYWAVFFAIFHIVRLFSLMPLHLNDKSRLKSSTIDPAKTWNKYAWCHQCLFYDIKLSHNNNIKPIQTEMERNLNLFYSQIKGGAHWGLSKACKWVQSKS